MRNRAGTPSPVSGPDRPLAQAFALGDVLEPDGLERLVRARTVESTAVLPASSRPPRASAGSVRYPPRAVGLLAPTRRDLAEEFNRGLAGMTEGPVALDDLVGSREALIANVVGRMPEAHRRFLLSFEVGAPDWSLLDVPNAATLPAVQWRMANLARLDRRWRSQLVAGLETALAESASGASATHPDRSRRSRSAATLHQRAPIATIVKRHRTCWQLQGTRKA